MPIAAVTDVERTSEPARLRVGERLRELVSYREILMNLIRKELKVKYTASALGAVWSLLNPVVFLAVFSFVVLVLGNRIPDYPVFLLSGLLAWNFFSASLQAGARSVVDNASLVKKVAFPREVLPLSSIGVASFDLLLQSAVLWLFILVSGHGLHLPDLWIYPLAFAVLITFTTAATFFVAAMNVRYRDVGHLLNLGLLVWFWVTPIVYQGFLVQRELRGVEFAGISAWNLFLLNPLATIVLGFQRSLYAIVVPDGPGAEPILPTVSLGWHAATLLALLGISIGLLLLAWRSFFRRSGDFAEEL